MLKQNMYRGNELRTFKLLVFDHSHCKTTLDAIGSLKDEKMSCTFHGTNHSVILTEPNSQQTISYLTYTVGNIHIMSEMEETNYTSAFSVHFKQFL
jgi:hypothetical protein